MVKLIESLRGSSNGGITPNKNAINIKCNSKRIPVNFSIKSDYVIKIKKGGKVEKYDEGNLEEE